VAETATGSSEDRPSPEPGPSPAVPPNESARPPSDRPRRAASAWWRSPRLWRGVLVVVVLAPILKYVLEPQVADARRTLASLAQVSGGYLVSGFLLEFLSLLVFSILTRTVLPSVGRPPLTTLVRIDLTALGINHVVPGGVATANAVRYRLLSASGVSGADAAFCAAVQGVGSAIVLNAMLWIWLLAAIPRYGLTRFFGLFAGFDTVLLAAAILVTLALTRGENWTVRRVRAIVRPIPRVSADGAERQVRQFTTHLKTFGGNRPLMVRAVLWAVLNWLLDAASLWTFVASFGHHVNIGGLLVAYGLANVLAVLPVTPGGLGIVEGVLVSTLITVGCPAGIAVLGVLGWRLVNFWLPIPVSALTYLSLRTGPWRMRPT
jgi:uncharacterized protein (TIRG00374 family)